MKRSLVLVWFVMTASAGGLVPAPARAQAASPMAGVWTLNRSLSEFPREIGFNANWWPASTGDGQSTSPSGGGRGRRGSAGPFSGRSESYEDARRVQLLTAEVRTPPVRLMVVDTPAAVTITFAGS